MKQKLWFNIASWLLAAFLLFGAFGNAFPSAEITESYARWGYPNGFNYVTAAVELLSALLLPALATRFVGAGLATLSMAAATVTVAYFGEYAHAILPACVMLVSLAVAAVSFRPSGSPARSVTR
jgi:hypothetical protein